MYKTHVQNTEKGKRISSTSRFLLPLTSLLGLGTEGSILLLLWDRNERDIERGGDRSRGRKQRRDARLVTEGEQPVAGRWFPGDGRADLHLSSTDFDGESARLGLGGFCFHWFWFHHPSPSSFFWRTARQIEPVGQKRPGSPLRLWEIDRLGRFMRGDRLSSFRLRFFFWFFSLNGTNALRGITDSGMRLITGDRWEIVKRAWDSLRGRITGVAGMWQGLTGCSCLSESWP